MSKWEEKELGCLIEIKHGYAFSGEYISDDDNGNVLVTPGNFDFGGGFKHSGKKFFWGNLSKKFVLKCNDIIVTMTDLSKNADTLGYAALVPNDAKVYLHNQRIGLVSIKSEEIIKGYLYWTLRTPWYQRRIANTSNGANVKHTSPKRIYNYKFILPDLPTQKKIADILSAYDDLIENNSRRIELLEKAAQDLYKEWFVRFRFPDYENTEFENGLPEGWQVKRLGKYGQVETGKTPATAVFENYGKEVLFIKTPDMHDNMFIIETEEMLSEIGSKTQAKKLLPPNSIMVSCIGTGGVVAINEKPAHTNQQINSIILNDQKYLEWLYFTCKGLKETIELFGATGATMTNLSKGKFEKLKVVDPDKCLVYKFNNQISHSFDLIKNLMNKNQNLKKQRDLLLPRLMSGKLEV